VEPVPANLHEASAAIERELRRLADAANRQLAIDFSAAGQALQRERCGGKLDLRKMFGIEEFRRFCPAFVMAAAHVHRVRIDRGIDAGRGLVGAQRAVHGAELAVQADDVQHLDFKCRLRAFGVEREDLFHCISRTAARAQRDDQQ